MLAAYLTLSLLSGAGMAQPPASEAKPAPSVREFPPKDPQLKPVKVADVIKGLGLDETKMHHSDEPPGKLRAISWRKVKLPGTDAEVDVEIEIVYTLDVFSDKRNWDIKAIRAATVTKVTIVPPGSRD